jgi:YDG domain
VVGLSTNANLGTLREVAGAAKTLAIQTQPSPTATAGVAFVPQPVLQVRDQFGNLRSSANGVSDSTVVTAARGAGSGTLQGTLSMTASNGTARFSNLSHNVATNITLAFSASGLSGTNSSTIAVSAAAASQLVFTTQPGSSSYGSALSPQPVLQSQDAFGNYSTVGLGSSQSLTLSLSAGSGSLQGTTTLDIGTGANNGVAVFSGLTVNAAGSGKQLTAASSGLSNALSSTFAVSQATVSANVTVSNKVYDGTTAATIATSSLSGVLPGDNVSLSGGTATFSSSVTGLSLSGTTAANYQLASTSVSTIANITARPLTISASAKRCRRILTSTKE